MPQQTATPTLNNTLRKRLASPFDEDERKKLLGNNDALQTQIEGLTSGLGAFDATAERSRREGLLESQAQQARENIGRTFALDPSGIQTGAAIRPFSAIEGARLSNLAALESEISQRRGAENRANLGALQSLQGQGQQANLQAGALGLQGLGQLQNQVQFDTSTGLQNEQFGRSLAEQGRQFDTSTGLQNEQFGRGLTEQGRQFDTSTGLQAAGLFGGSLVLDASGNPMLNAQGNPVQRDTLASQQLSQQGGQFNRQLAEQGRQFDKGQELTIQQNLGNIGGQQTLAGQQLANQIGINNRAATLAEQAERGRQTGVFSLGEEEDRDTLANRQLAQQATQFTSSLGEQTAARTDANRLAEQQLTGRGSREIAPGVFETFETLASQELNKQLGLQEAGLFGGELLRDAEGNPLFDDAGQPLTRATLASQQLAQQQQQAQAQLALQQSELFGGSLLLDAQGNPVLDAQGNPVQRETLGAQQLAQQGQQFGDTLGLQREELFGTDAIPRIIFDPSQGGGQITELLRQASGLMSGTELGQLEARTRAGDVLNDPQKRLDIVRDAINNKKQAGSTLAQQQLDLQRTQLIEQQLARQEANALQRLGLTGTEGGAETIDMQQLAQQDAQFAAQLSQRGSEFARQFGLSEAELFGGGPSVTWKQEELDRSFGSSVGDPQYRPEFDIDGNGTFEFPDFIALTQNSADLGNGVRQHIPDDGRRTLGQQQLDTSVANAAREFGLEESRLTEATRQFDDQFGQAKREFNSLTSGLVFNDNGTIKHKWGVNEFGSPVAVPVTTLERDQFIEQKRQFNEKFNFDVEALAQKLDLDLKELESDQFKTLLSFAASIANTAGTVFGGSKNTPTQQDFSTVQSRSTGFHRNVTDLPEF